MDDALAERLERLRHGDVAARTAAARELAQASPVPAAATADLVKALEHPYDDRWTPWVESALENIESPPPHQALLLVEVLLRFQSDSGHVDAAFWAITMLGRMGMAGTAGLAALLALLERDDFPQLQFKAAWALGKLGPAAKEALPSLARAASHASHPRLAAAARHAISEIDR
jgi:hypothetical protein